MQPQADTTHIGIAENQAVETPSSNPVDYTWILFKGPQGEKGIQGERGIQGPPGEKGEPGKDGTDGKPGESVKPNWNTWVFKQSELQPSKPNFLYLLREQQVLMVGLMVRDLLVDGGCQWV